jgi:hypothetical protein
MKRILLCRRPDRDGKFEMTRVPPGIYTLGIWYEFGSESELRSLAREVEVKAGDNALNMITLHSSDATSDHLNKYGEPYPVDKPIKY